MTRKGTAVLLAAVAASLGACAAPVALSLTNAADYVSTIPVNSNLIQGIGMGAGGAYRTVRAEDAEFLATALRERLHFASGSGGRYTELGTAYKEVGMVPTRPRWVLDDYDYSNMISNSYPATWGEAIRPAVGGGAGDRHGFVPAAFTVWDGYAPSQATNSWIRNGFDAESDLRAVFAAGATGYGAQDVPFALTNLFRNVPTLVAITNAYGFLDSGMCSNLLASARPVEVDAGGARFSFTTNSFSISNGETEGVWYYWSKGYQYGDEWYSVVTNVDYRSDPGGSYSGTSVVGQSMNCYIEREVTYSTQFSVRRTGESSGVATFFRTTKTSDRTYLSVPSNGTPWTVNFLLVAGERDGETFYNTNLTMRAWLVSLWECVSTVRRARNLGLPARWDIDAAVTTRVQRVISSYPLGNLVNVTNGLWASSGTFEGYGTGVGDTQLAMFEVCGGFFDNGSFSDVAPVDPEVVDASDYPSTFTNGWTGTASLYYGQGSTLRRHELRSVGNYAVLIVNPVYIARALGELQGP